MIQFLADNYSVWIHIQSAADLTCFLGESNNARYTGQHGKSAYVKIEVKIWEYGIQFKFFLLLKVFFDLLIILHA